jgi:hypothetical protein
MMTGAVASDCMASWPPLRVACAGHQIPQGCSFSRCRPLAIGQPRNWPERDGEATMTSRASPIELLAQAVIAGLAHAAKFKTVMVPIGVEGHPNEILIIFSFFI